MVPPLKSHFTLLDVFLANDEVDMVRFRLRLHSPVTTRFIIAESNYTHTGTPKPLHMRDSLAPSELTRYNVRLVVVPFTDKQHMKANWCTNAAIEPNHAQGFSR